jgi:hypothetical protein
MRLVSLSPKNQSRKRNVKSRFAQKQRKISSIREKVVKDLNLKQAFKQNDTAEKAMVLEISKDDPRYETYVQKLGRLYSNDKRRAFSPPPVLRFLAVKSNDLAKQMSKISENNRKLPKLSVKDNSFSEESSPKDTFSNLNATKR